MKIEKISENQLKIILNRADLTERDIDLIELVNGSDKTHNLLKEMMDQALLEYNFQISNSPIVIEAAPLSVDSLMLIITKMDGEPADMGFDGGLSLLSEIAKLSGYKKRGVTQSKARIVKKQEEVNTVFSFEKLDDVIDASVRLCGVFEGESFLVKNSGRYFLMLSNVQTENKPPIGKLNSILSEYGQKQTATNLSEQFLKEHGEVIINDQATIKLAAYL